jgi:hypothetical protein
LIAVLVMAVFVLSHLATMPHAPGPCAERNTRRLCVGGTPLWCMRVVHRITMQRSK